MLASLTGFQTVFVLLYIFIGILLIGIILLQKGRGGGIGSAFGGGGGGSSAFGAKTGDVFTWITVVLAGLAILVGVAGNYILEPAGASQTQPQISAPPGTPTDSPAQTPATTPPATPATETATPSPVPVPLTPAPIDTSDESLPADSSPE